MQKNFLWILVASFGLWLVSCEKSEPVMFPEAGELVKESLYPNSEEGLKKLAADFNHNGELLGALLPTKEECALIGATPEDAQILVAYLEKLRAQLPPEGLGGRESQTEVLLRSGTTDAMKAGEDADMPGGYSRTAEHYQRGLTVWSVSYVEPGEESGMRYDGFVHVNERWVLLPKFWRAFP